ncbi:MAG: hypothetical protein AAGA23_05140 [Pseudomonadota bacterium]
MGREEEHKTQLPAEGVEPSFLPHPLLDQLLQTVIALGAELWVERDRRMVLEKLLEERGVLSREDIETCEPDESLQADRDKARAALLERTLGGLEHLGND